ncbi:MAG: CheR family methyltransferase, partial [Candidatus Entotheonellia bacterium]
YLQQHRDELDALYHDLLIKVTGFFRDPDTFEALKREVFPSLMHERPSNKPIRIWVPGCASGEEVYSIAICLLEFLGERTFNPAIQVFATDVDEVTLTKARAGRYIENIALDVSPERLRRFFVKVDHYYQISRVVREMCTFSSHNLGKDPPFSKLDLISCRNVLIYFDPALQKRVLPLFHFALNANGFLTLGSSEGIGLFADLFTQVDKKHKIYSKRATAHRPPLDYFTPREHSATDGDIATPGRPTDEALWIDVDVSREADRVILNQYAPAGVVINDQMDILQFRGDTSHYLRPAPGRASFDLLRMAREGLLVDLRAALTQAKHAGDPVTREGVRVQYEGKSLDITLRVIPLTLPPPPAFRFVVLFEESPAPAVRPVPRRARRRTAATGEDERQRNSQLEQELEATKQYLQSVIEQHEAANEELRSANEEVLSSNEELQSTNEELETAKEELQSANEELGTVNEEVRHRNLELSQLNDDLNNLFGSANLPIIMLGNDLRIRRFTPVAEKLLNVISTDIGRPIGHLQLNVSIPDLESLIREAIDTVSPKEREVQDREGHWYSMRIRPYMTAEHKIDGAVLLLIDIDSLKDIDRLTRLLEEVKTAQNYAEGIVQS